MGDVAFHTATTVDEALALVGDGSDAKVVAGGSDLIVQARGGRALPSTVVAIHRIDALRSIDALSAGRTIMPDSSIHTAIGMFWKPNS